MENYRRREVLKLLGASALTMTYPLQAQTTLTAPVSHKKAKIVIVGAGTGGVLSAARIRRAAPNAQIIMIAPNEKHLYQSGQLFVASGIEKSSNIDIRQTADLLPENVTWIKEKVEVFEPENNRIFTEKGTPIAYDIMIVALGSQYDYNEVEGLDSSMIGKEGIASVYLNDTIQGSNEGGFLTNVAINALHYEAQNRPVKALFAQAKGSIKAEGTALSMLMLMQHYMQEKGVSKNISYTFSTPKNHLFFLPSFAKVLERKFSKQKNTALAFSHHLKAIDAKKRVALFEVNQKEKAIAYDFIHITPTLKAPKVLANSPLALQDGHRQGWMDVDEKTLQHPHFKNVFGIGDILGFSHLKSAAAAAHQGIILQDNIAYALENKPLPASYDGYSASPIITEYGKCMLAEFNKKGIAPTLPLDPYTSRKLWWIWQKSWMRSLYFNLLMRGMM